MSTCLGEARRAQAKAARGGWGQPKSHSTKGGGIDNYNEICFEDKKGEEKFNIQAEKDMTTLVKNNQTNTIKASRSSSTGGSDSVSVGGDRSLSVTGTNTITITKSDTEDYKDIRTTTVKGPDTLTITNDHSGTYGHLEQIRDSLRGTTDLYHDQVGQLRAAIRVWGQAEYFDYDAAGNRIATARLNVATPPPPDQVFAPGYGPASMNRGELGNRGAVVDVASIGLGNRMTRRSCRPVVVSSS